MPPEETTAIDDVVEADSVFRLMSLRRAASLPSPLASPPLTTPSCEIVAADSAAQKRHFAIVDRGGMASGKTTICGMIIQQRVVLVNQDSFYRDLTPKELERVHEYNFDHQGYSANQAIVLLIHKRVPESHIIFLNLISDSFYCSLTTTKLERVHKYNFDNPDAFNAEQLLECVEKLKCGQPVHVPMYDIKTHQRCSDSFCQAPEGIRYVCKRFPSLKIVTSQIDVAMNKKFMGEFSDHYFGNRLEVDKYMSLGGAKRSNKVTRAPGSTEWMHTAEFRGAGMRNDHKICYVNAVIQCLAHTGIFFKAIVSETHKLICTCQEGTRVFCFLHCLRRLFNDLTSGREIISPHELIEVLSYFSESFNRDKENSSAQFLESFFSKLEVNHDWERGDISLLEKMFGGCIYGTFICSSSSCGQLRHVTRDVSPLYIKFTVKENDIEHALKRTMLMMEEKCSCGVQNYYEGKIIQTPEVVVFVLCDISKKRKGRPERRLSFKMTLDLTTHTTDLVRHENANGAKDPVMYELYAVLVHKQYSPTSGHVYTFARTGHDVWYKFNDAWVSRVEREDVLNANPLMLFYKKMGSLWFSRVVREHKGL